MKKVQLQGGGAFYKGNYKSNNEVKLNYKGTPINTYQRFPTYRETVD